MSVDIEKLIRESGADPKEIVTTSKHTGSVAFTAESVRVIDLLVGTDPIPENPFHGQVWPGLGRRRFSSAQKSHLLRSASWYVQIPDVTLG